MAPRVERPRVAEGPPVAGGGDVELYRQRRAQLPPGSATQVRLLHRHQCRLIREAARAPEGRHRRRALGHQGRRRGHARIGGAFRGEEHARERGAGTGPGWNLGRGHTRRIGAGDGQRGQGPHVLPRRRPRDRNDLLQHQLDARSGAPVREPWLSARRRGERQENPRTAPRHARGHESVGSRNPSPASARSPSPAAT